MNTRQNFGRSLLAGILVVIPNLNCAPTPTWDPQSQQYRVENQFDSNEAGATLLETVFGGPIPRAFANATRKAGEGRRMRSLVDENTRLRRENTALRMGKSQDGDENLRGYLSDQELLAAVQQDPCYFSKYLGNASETSGDMNHLAQFVGDWVGEYAVEDKNGRQIAKGENYEYNRLVCNDTVLVSEVRTHPPGHKTRAGWIKVPFKSRSVNYICWDEKTGSYQSIGFNETWVGNNSPTRGKITRAELTYDDELNLLYCDNSDGINYTTAPLAQAYRGPLENIKSFKGVEYMSEGEKNTKAEVVSNGQEFRLRGRSSREGK